MLTIYNPKDMLLRKEDLKGSRNARLSCQPNCSDISAEWRTRTDVRYERLKRKVWLPAKALKDYFKSR